jgi:hypothetical protein
MGLETPLRASLQYKEPNAQYFDKCYSELAELLTVTLVELLSTSAQCLNS